jgi:hypothetical protein
VIPRQKPAYDGLGELPDIKANHGCESLAAGGRDSRARRCVRRSAGARCHSRRLPGQAVRSGSRGCDGIIPATVKAGPYAVPGRIDLVNYDLGGEGVAYHSEAHHTTKDGDGYRDDRPTATMCKTATSKPDLWYDST